MGWMGIGWVLGLALIAVLVWWGLLRTPRGPAGGPPLPSSPREILRGRYARGEIDRETYQRMLKDLED